MHALQANYWSASLTKLVTVSREAPNRFISHDEVVIQNVSRPLQLLYTPVLHHACGTQPLGLSSHSTDLTLGLSSTEVGGRWIKNFPV